MSFRPVRKITGIGNVFLGEELVDIAECDLEIYEENPEAHEHHGADWTPGVELLGQAFGTYLQRHAGPKINLGRDTRLSSPRLRDALMRGLKASGCHVTDLGVVPTPVLYFSQFHLKADGAVMITGSHNPAEFNGFKTVCGQSTIHGEAIQELRRMMESGDLVRGEGSETTADCVTPYWRRLPRSSSSLAK